MVLFVQILFTMFIAEMGDKTQLLMVAMMSRYRMRDIILGSVSSILALNAIAVAFGALVSEMIPTWLIKTVAGLAFFYFAWSTLNEKEEEDAEHTDKGNAHPILTVFGTFFLAELGDKTQLTAIAFAGSGGLSNALVVWLACSIGLFAADVIGMLLGSVIKDRMSDGFLDKLAFVIFAVFGFTTLAEGVGLAPGISGLRWLVACCALIIFVIICRATWKRSENGKMRGDSSER
ncbi:MAG: TMEM165/GDT1 family protein [Clostridiales bacterium]|nr:TMEM165/GDT1 family protein [Clostridiales bacterium]